MSTPPGAIAGTVKLVLKVPSGRTVTPSFTGAPAKSIATALQGDGQNPLPVAVTTVPPGPAAGFTDSWGVAANAGEAKTNIDVVTLSIATRTRGDVLMTVR